MRGLIAVWLWTLRAWERDESADLSATMAALDTALGRAEQAMRWLRGQPAPAPQSEAAQSETQPEAAHAPEVEPPPAAEPSSDTPPS